MVFGQIGDDWFELQAHSLGTTAKWLVTIPYGVVNQAWVDSSGTVMLLLSVRVVLRDTKPLARAVRIGRGPKFEVLNGGT